MIKQDILRIPNRSEKKGRFLIQELDDELNSNEIFPNIHNNFEKILLNKTKHSSICVGKLKNKKINFLHNEYENLNNQKNFSSFILENNSNDWIDFEIIWKDILNSHSKKYENNLEKIFNYTDLISDKENDSNYSFYFNDSLNKNIKYKYDQSIQKINLFDDDLDYNKNFAIENNQIKDNFTNIQTTYDNSNSNITDLQTLSNLVSPRSKILQYKYDKNKYSDDQISDCNMNIFNIDKNEINNKCILNPYTTFIGDNYFKNKENDFQLNLENKPKMEINTQINQLNEKLENKIESYVIRNKNHLKIGNDFEIIDNFFEDKTRDNEKSDMQKIDCIKQSPEMNHLLETQKNFPNINSSKEIPIKKVIQSYFHEDDQNLEIIFCRNEKISLPDFSVINSNNCYKIEVDKDLKIGNKIIEYSSKDINDRLTFLEDYFREEKYHLNKNQKRKFSEFDSHKNFEKFFSSKLKITNAHSFCFLIKRKKINPKINFNPKKNLNLQISPNLQIEIYTSNNIDENTNDEKENNIIKQNLYENNRLDAKMYNCFSCENRILL